MPAHICIFTLCCDRQLNLPKSSETSDNGITSNKNDDDQDDENDGNNNKKRKVPNEKTVKGY